MNIICSVFPSPTDITKPMGSCMLISFITVAFQRWESIGLRLLVILPMGSNKRGAWLLQKHMMNIGAPEEYLEDMRSFLNLKG